MTFTRAENLRFFLIGYVAGVVVFVLITLAGQFLTDPCRGRTLLSVFAPFLLGPGGLAVAAYGWSRSGWGMVGLGLAAASLFPALFFAGQTLRSLQALGCAT